MSEKMVSLGFCSGLHASSKHVCQIYNNPLEKLDLVSKYLEAGVLGKERVSCFSDDLTSEMVLSYLNDHHGELREALTHGVLTFHKTPPVYFPNSCFEPDIMLELLKNYYTSSIEAGFFSARVVGEMNPTVKNLPGGHRITEYEARVNQLIREYPVTCVCQYDAREFTGEEVMEILKVHPLMMVKGHIIENPFFISPEDYLSNLSS